MNKKGHFRDNGGGRQCPDIASVCPISSMAEAPLSGTVQTGKSVIFEVPGAIPKNMIQQLLVILLFAGALAYLGRLLYRSFKAKSAGCASGCGKCGAIDVARIEAQIRKKENLQRNS